MSLFTRAIDLFKSEANAALDEAENPEKMLKQGIRDLKGDLREAKEALAETKSVVNKLERDMNEAKKRAENYQSDAKKLLRQAKEGDMDSAKAEELATKALNEKKEAQSKAKELKSSHEAQKTQAEKLQQQVSKLQQKIDQYESELTTLRARSKAATATRKVNEQLAQSDGDGTIAMMERMKEKVEKEEDMAAAYGEMAEANKSVDEEIDEALEGASTSDTNEELERLKAELDSE